MNNIPVIFLGFANQNKAYLPQLSQERKNIEKLLHPLVRNRQIQCVSEAETAFNDMFTKFNQYRGQIKILHYAGHANGDQLALVDQPLSGETLASLARVKAAKSPLALIFLNGCATKNQVKCLLEAGVQNVIATARSIQDDQARRFAEQFYEALALDASIKEAYETASAYIKHQKLPLPQFRHLGKIRDWEDLNELNASVAFPWGLYAKNGQASDWSIPIKQVKESASDEEPKPNTPGDTISNYGDGNTVVTRPQAGGDMHIGQSK